MAAQGEDGPGPEVLLAKNNPKIKILPADDALPKTEDGASTAMVIAARDVEVMHAPSPEDVAEAALIDAAVLHINGLYGKAGVKLAQEIGQYILDKFYGGSLEEFRSHKGKKFSLRRLADDPRLKVDGGFPFLSRCVGVAVLYPKLPEPVRKQLRWSEYGEILPVKDDALQLKLASDAVEHPRTVRDYRAHVRHELRQAGQRPPKSNRPQVPSAKGLATIVQDAARRLAGAPTDPSTPHLATLSEALGTLDTEIDTFFAKVRRDGRAGVATSQHRTAPTHGAVEADDRHGNLLFERAEGIIQGAASLSVEDRWKLLRDLKGLFQRNYESCPRPPISDLIAKLTPLPAVGGYGGSKRPVVTELLHELAKQVPQEGPYARVLMEPFTGMASLAGYALLAGLVDQVRLNDADPAVASMWTVIINAPEQLTDALLSERVPKKLTKDYLDGLWATVNAFRDSAAGQEPATEGVPSAHLGVADDGTLVVDQRNDPDWAEEVLRRLQKLRAEVTGEPVTIHLFVEVAYSAAILLQCSRGYGLARSPSALWAEGEWDPAQLAETIMKWHDALRGRVVGNECTCRSAFDVLQEAGWGLGFIDPPYWGTEHHYPKCKFGPREHQRLQRLLSKIRSRKWLLTYGDHPEIRERYPAEAFNLTEMPVWRSEKQRAETELWISPKGDHRPEWEEGNVEIKGVR